MKILQKSSPKSHLGLIKLRVSHSLDFTLGLTMPPKRDRGKTATKFVKDAYRVGLRWQEFIQVETDQALIDRVQKNVGNLSFIQASDLFHAYQVEAESHLSQGDIDKAIEVDAKALKLVERINALNPATDRSLVGLSALTNSHKNSQQQDTIEKPTEGRHFQKRVKRGFRGITVYGKRVVRSCGVILEEKFKRQNLTLGTCTLPPLEREELVSICRSWSELTRQFFQELTRLLERLGLATDYVQVTELQEKRFQQWGQVCPHLHWVCQGRVSRFDDWRITPLMIRNLWERLLGGFLGRSVDGRVATRIESPRKSLAGELGKYLSKGGKAVKAVIEAGKEDLLPSAWWGASRALKREEKTKRIEKTGDIPRLLFDNLESLRAMGAIWFTRIYVNYTCPQTGIEIEKCVGVAGRFCNRSVLNQLLSSQLPTSFVSVSA